MAQQSTLNVLVERQGSLPIVHVFGEVDMCTVHEAARPLRHELSAPPAALVLNLIDVTFIDAAGMRMLVEAQSAADSTDTDLQVALARIVWRPLDLLGLTEDFATHRTLAAAVAATAA
ncbi:STAS domain-containing protein [Kutzneria sp. CA-103260]|uniref:STAS domain-containing protein n=1 Tax=Kutzneria sp. CA-103260 TaxID=2802641 RepID=UPI001BAB9F26|nr:STAS domain-containing protein [Kutzneria sp. CA-103260]QUQ65183.1 anti-anti-sigma factor [Kutzneria sp. CA-103260]